MSPWQRHSWTHLDLDGEGVDEVFWDAVGVPGSVHAHGDELALQVSIGYCTQRKDRP